MVPRDDAALHAVGAQSGQCLGRPGAQGFGQAEAGLQGDSRRGSRAFSGVGRGGSRVRCGVSSGMRIRF